MIISGEENISKNLSCEEIYSVLIDEINELITKNSSAKTDTASITNSEQKNPFIQENESNDSIDTFVPIGGLKAYFKESIEMVFADMTPNELNKFLTMIIQIKNMSHGKTTRFKTKAVDFLQFLKTFFANTKQLISPIENFIQNLEIDKNREIVKPFAIKYFKVVFYMQNSYRPTFYEISVMNNLMKQHYSSDNYFAQIMDFVLKEYTLSIARKYSCNTTIILDSEHCHGFCKLVRNTINAFNGTIIELDTEANEISRVIFTILVFYLNEKESVFNKMHGWKELFYCALRSVYQGTEFAKKLECMVSSKLRWKFAMENEEYTIDKAYQTLFKYEYLKFIGKVRSGLGDNFSFSMRHFSDSDGQSSSEKDQRVMITKIIQTTPKSFKGESGFAFSPLSRRIGERTPTKETLNSKRKLKFD